MGSRAKRILLAAILGGTAGYVGTHLVSKAKIQVKDDLAMARTLMEIRAL